MIYFDHNASTPLAPGVLEAMQPFLTDCYANPSSLHRSGRLVRSAIDSAREQVAALVDAHPSQLTFTSGGTEANNQALFALAAEHPDGAIGVAATEHPSVIKPLEQLEESGRRLEWISVDHNGLIEPNELEQQCHKPLSFVSIMAANNETGVIQDMTVLSAITQAFQIPLHCDAIQAAGKIPLSFAATGAQLMTLSGHKIYGPKGVGALITDSSVALKPLLYGGGQENQLRSGTENVAAIIGFGCAAEIARSEQSQRQQQLTALKKQLEEGLKTIPSVTIFAEPVDRLPNTTLFGVSGIDGEMLVMLFDQHSIALTSGSACASGGKAPSRVLTAMGVPSAEALSAVRVSLGVGNSREQIDHFLSVLQALV